jgi:hypothetical protein
MLASANDFTRLTGKLLADSYRLWANQHAKEGH